MEYDVMRTVILIIAAVFWLPVSCCRTEFVPQEGDLVFRVAGDSDAGQAIAAATAQADSVKYEHVGIVEVRYGNVNVIEATGRGGVVRTPYNTFISDSPLVGGNSGVVVKRLDSNALDNEPELAHRAVERAASHIGEEYDWYYLPDNGRMYCSELVYVSWLDSEGNPVFDTVKMNFRDAEGNMPQYWTDLFSRLGRPVPEGKPGTNPNDMSRASVLEEVHRYF